MKIFLFAILFVAAAQAEIKGYHGHSVYRIKHNTVDSFDKVWDVIEEFELDLWRQPRFLGDYADILVPLFRKSQFNTFLATTGMEYEIFIEDVQKIIEKQPRRPQSVAKSLNDFDYEVYHDFAEIQNWIDLMVSENSGLVQKKDFGSSFEKKPMTALTIGAGVNSPKFVINCGIHAREWITPASCLVAADQLVRGYGVDQETTELLDKVDFVFIPVSNPDGYQHSHVNERLWRKTRTKQDGSECFGVDPNRNFDSNFGGTGSSDNPCSQTYHGPAPFSEPSTKAQKDYVESLTNVQVYMDVHSYSQLWLFPFGYKSELTQNHDVLNQLAANCTDAIFAVDRKVYEYGPTYTTIYPASGITSDYFYDGAEIPCSYTAELRDRGRYGFLLPEDQIMMTALETYAGFKVLARAIIDGKCASKSPPI